jgi:3-hydroxyisobutyrate dehydrogenase
MSTNATTVGLIGVGLMGHGIATNILKAGYQLAFLSHPGNQPTDDLIALGANAQPHVAEIARRSQIIILCVTGSPALEAILYQDGLLNALKPGTVIIDCSTAMPSSTLRIAHDVHAKGGQFMDAPMTRTPKEAAQGRLNLIVGATPELFDHCTPLLRSFAENIVHAGPVGSGHRMKLIHNFVSLGFAAVVSEAAACAHDAGIDSDVLLQVLSKGGGDGVVLNRLKPYIETRDNSGFYFSLSNAMKDMTYYDDMAMESGAAHTVANAVKVSYALAASQDPEAKVPDLMGMLLKDKPHP